MFEDRALILRLGVDESQVSRRWRAREILEAREKSGVQVG